MSQVDKFLISANISDLDIDFKAIDGLLADRQTIKMIGHSLSKEEINKSLHNLRSAFRTLTMLSENLKEGYRFDDDMAEAKIATIEKSIIKLQPFKDLLEKVFED